MKIIKRNGSETVFGYNKRSSWDQQSEQHGGEADRLTERQIQRIAERAWC